MKCVYGSRSNDGLGNCGAEIIEVDCLTCGKHMSCRKIGNEQKWGKFCSRICYGSYRSKHPDLYKTNTSAMHTIESNQKRKNSLQETMNQPGWVSHFKGKHHTPETIERLRAAKLANPSIGSKNGMYGRKHTDAAREAMSDKHTKLLITGQVRPYGCNSKRGVHYSNKLNKCCAYKSGWELAVMQFLDANPIVTSWEYESFRISYIHNNHKRWYVPDFLVTFQDGHRELWEVKPKEFIETEKNKLKTEVARMWCQENQVDKYELLTGDVLRQQGII